MRLLFTVILISYSLGLLAQSSTDSLKTVLQSTPANRENLSHFTGFIRKLNPDDTAMARMVFVWIVKNSTIDSLADIQAEAHLAMGRLFTIATQYGEATKYLVKAEEISSKKNLPVILAQTLNILGSIYENNDPSGKAAHYYKESISISKKQNYLPGIIKATYNLGKMQFERSYQDHISPQVGLQLMRQAYSLAVSSKDTQSMITQANGLSTVYTKLGQHDSAIRLTNYAEGLLKSFGKETNFLNYYVLLGNSYRAKKEYRKSLDYLNSGLTLAEKYDAPRWLCTYYYNLADTYEQMGDYKNANYFNQLNVKMHNNLVTKENFIAAADIQNKYERLKKDNDILKLQSVNKQRSILNKIFIGVSIGLALIGFLIYMNYRKSRQLSDQQQALQHQKILELEKDRQLVAIDSMLKGQEEERSRVAKDLHDGLGSMLSGAKHSFADLRERIPLSAETEARFDRSIGLLNNTIFDLKKVAQNLMPETLSKFGLREAVKDFCHSIEGTTGIRMELQVLGEKRVFDKTVETFCYRIIQELVNNAVKYSKASEIFVELLFGQKTIAITVEDNGIGFDKAILDLSKGSGMKNIQYRVDYLNGKLDIDSMPNNGTAVNILLNV